jgi:succinate dehydrogenase/fumarate reductase flavoprotein subunit
MAEISDQTSVAMPIRNLLAIISSVVVGAWAYFGVVERLNQIETKTQLMDSDLKKNNEFRIKTPQSPTDKEQYMLIEHISGQVEKIQKQLESMAHNKVNIIRLQKDVDKTMKNIEKLKDGQRSLKYNGK